MDDLPLNLLNCIQVFFKLTLILLDTRLEGSLQRSDAFGAHSYKPRIQIVRKNLESLLDFLVEHIVVIRNFLLYRRGRQSQDVRSPN